MQRSQKVEENQAGEASAAHAGVAALPLAGTPGAERRANHRLRELVDEMLASIRASTGSDLWTEEERRQYEAELAETMRRVRFEAVWHGRPHDGHH